MIFVIHIGHKSRIIKPLFKYPLPLFNNYAAYIRIIRYIPINLSRIIQTHTICNPRNRKIEGKGQQEADNKSYGFLIAYEKNC